MFKNDALIVLLWFFIAIIPIQSGGQERVNHHGELIFQRMQHKVLVEIADTREQRQKGLMNRKTLPIDSGMLFVFPGTSVRGVWMKNTLIPLDIMFISENGILMSWLENLRPCEDGACEVYRSPVPVKYMLEVNSGSIERWKLKLGDRVLLLTENQKQKQSND